MDLILITKTAMIEKIFLLVCKKLNITLAIKNDLNIEHSTDFIFIDEAFIDDNFNSLKQKTKKLAAITSEELSFDKSRDFILKRPFLPTQLEELLNEQIIVIKNDNENEKEFSKNINEEELASNYIESLADDIAYNIDEESDESIVNIASIKDGGILDNLELNKIRDILHDEDISNEVIANTSDWKDISEIIDDALSEVDEYEFDIDLAEKKVIRLILNNYNISELKPFLQKFDQKVIDRLSNGEDVDITLCMKVNK